ncbi:peptidoglycan-binding protein [Roseivivax marinus]|uniref:peptidoglycan-binding protein n=1 Tax=Roseivivax marinus TaxID=1379903 RepID=UPI00273F759E|nr:peptidoglycan-binding protein [Roseivivax marinus]
MNRTLTAVLATLPAAALALTLLPREADAAGDALIFANGEYDDMPRLSGANRVLAAAEPLERQGFAVTRLVEGASDEMREALRDFLAGIDSETDRVAAILSGRFVHTEAETYLLPPDAPDPLDEAAVLTEGLPVSALLGVLADFPGSAVLLIAEDEMDTLRETRFLSAGSGPIEPPQGVTLVRGTPRQIERLARRDLATPSRDFAEAVRDAELEMEGYAPRRMVFIDEAFEPEPEREEPAPEPEQTTEDRGEERLWSSVSQRDDAAGYETYLSAYPDGAHAATARDRLEYLRDAPGRQAEADEDALNLSRTERQEIQSDLTSLDYDTRGVDGIFGQGSRQAIRSWQEANGQEATGFLTRRQIERIDAQAASAERRAAEERDRADRAYWSEISPDPGAEQLRTYLDRYPDGIYASDARSRLDSLEQSARDRAAQRDRDAFVAARDQDTVRAYQLYIEEWPNGAFTDRAEQRIRALRQAAQERQGGNVQDGGSASGSRAAAEEAAMNLPNMAWAIAERQLAANGHNPGQVDGTVDGQTRRALAAYQADKGLTAHGYLDQATAAQLLSDTVFGRF